MAITHADPLRQAAVDTKLGMLNNGTGNPNAQLIYMDAADATIVTAEMSNPAFGAASATGAATAGAVADTGNGTGTVALFKFVDRDGTEGIRGTVTGVGGGGDFELSSVTLANEPIRTNSITYTEGQ